MILVDAGPLIAAGDRDAHNHDECLEAVVAARPPRYVPGTVVAEVCYLLARAAGTQAEAQFLDLLGSGFLSPVDLTPEGYQRAAQLVRRYADLPLGGVDASLVAVAERLGIAELVTLDMRHFTVVRPNHVEAFRLSP